MKKRTIAYLIVVMSLGFSPLSALSGFNSNDNPQSEIEITSVFDSTLAQ